MLVADKNIEACVTGLLSKPKALDISAVKSAVYVHPGRDAGCHLRCHDFLAGFVRQFRFAIVLHDRDGCGRTGLDRNQLELDIENRLHRSGWENRSAAVVLDPELEAWVWSDSPQVAHVLGWKNGIADLKRWIVQNGESLLASGKPNDPKQAVEKVLRHLRIPRSSSLYRRLAEEVSTRRCQDPAFQKFKAVLQRWFPC